MKTSPASLYSMARWQVLIGFAYILVIGLTLSSLILFSGFATGNAASADVYQRYTCLGLLILAITETVGLYRRQYWARIFGIVLGILILAPTLLAPYTTGWPLQQVPKVLFSTTGYYPIYCSLIFLMWPKFYKDWRKERSSYAIALSLSLVGLALVTMNALSYKALMGPPMEQINAQNEIILKAGTAYKK